MILLKIRKFFVGSILFPIWRILVRPFVSPTAETKFIYWVVMGRHLNLKDPEDFNEKLQWLKLNWKDPLISVCADKYAVREYVTSQGCNDILNELYGVYDSPEDIPWELLPDKFVLKCTHGCGYNVICADKTNLDKKSTLSRIEQWMKSVHGRRYAEYHYYSIKPRIICERYIGTECGFPPDDYKIFCFNGVPYYVAIAAGRGINIKWNFLDLHWNRMDIALPKHNNGDMPIKPSCWDRMTEVAAKLSEPFPFVRVDLYNNNGLVIFGELTFTPAACLNRGYYSESGLKYVGGLMDLPVNVTWEDKLP